MADPAAQAAKQLANIEAATGLTVDDFADDLAATGLEKHGQMVQHLKQTHGLTHGNANLVAHTVRQQAAGGPAPEAALLDAQYSKGKAELRPVYERIASLAQACGDDVAVVVQKTGVSFRRSKQFALVQVPSAKRVQLGLNLDATPPGGRVAPVSGMCSHRVDLTTVAEVDDDVEAWLHQAYRRADA